MTSVKAWRIQQGSPSPNILPYLVEASQDIRAGDFVTLGTFTTASRVKKAALPLTANGLLGVAWHNVKTDASGNLVPQTLSTIDPGAVVNYPATFYSGLVDRPAGNYSGSATDIGSARLAVLVLNAQTELFLDVCAAANAATPVNLSLIGKPAGLQAVTNDTKLDISQTGATAGLVITAVGEREPNFNATANVNNGVWALVKNAFLQQQLGTFA